MSSIRDGFCSDAVGGIYSEVVLVIYWFTCTWIENLKYWSGRKRTERFFAVTVTDLTDSVDFNIKLLQKAAVRGKRSLEFVIALFLIFSYCYFMHFIMDREEEGGF